MYQETVNKAVDKINELNQNKSWLVKKQVNRGVYLIFEKFKS